VGVNKIMRKGLIIAVVLLATVFSSVAYAADPPSSLELNIPDYQVTAIGNIDYVYIPGGDVLLAEELRPRVPCYTKSLNYPVDYRVQDVILAERSALQTAVGLNLPPVILSEYPPTPIEIKGGWYPEEDFTWSVLENPDGSSTLTIVVYPFFYNPDTKESKFYKYYRFDIDSVVSTISITSLTLDKAVYQPAEKVTIDILLNNSGASQDVTASTTIKQYGSEVVVNGLPLRLLRNLAGSASLSAEWDSGNTAEGYYVAEVSLTDASGNTLDTETAGFGISKTAAASEEAGKFPVIPVAIGLAAVVAVISAFLILRSRRKTA
jgi:Glycosyl hydrolase family 66